MPQRRVHASSFSRSHVSPVNVEEPGRRLPHIHQPPVELLQQVFLLVNDVTDCPSIFSVGETAILVNIASPPLVLTRVCHRWRVVAHSTTGVWLRIQVALPERIEPFLPYSFQCWLARSGSRPLILRIVQVPLQIHHTCSTHPWPMPEAGSRLLDILLSESKRWETVVVMSSDVHDWGRDFDTPQLSTLECC
ncbi:uncharacterized protein EDB91DRAFT_496886 [Suillus paluster]|uniref:uncharacterized protein n=1 Tax=Suillus paluster TaxID=48578 RepID=UPI001B882D3A|nr:uncharacterized protein EDB91DRAFT_496886 [Suillus paluster]KAG1736922.1 hypothetical protein EDB91DRAFT_496886 [Suillus paluster]